MDIPSISIDYAERSKIKVVSSKFDWSDWVPLNPFMII
jgi:mannose-1-phosphate guanylyltransferase